MPLEEIKLLPIKLKKVANHTYTPKTPYFFIQEIIGKIKDGGIQQPFRPQLPSDLDRPKVVRLMMDCWDESLFKRPTFRYIKKQLKILTG